MNITEEVEEALRGALRSVKKNAAIRGRTVAITIDDVRLMWTSSDARCAVSGLPFDLRKCVNSRRRPFAMSIDRRDSRGEYTVENCRLVCVAVNYAMSDWGQEVLEKIAQAITARIRGIPRVTMRGGKNHHGFRGVTRRITRAGKLVYEVQITMDGKRRYGGTFSTPEAAHERWKSLQSESHQNLQIKQPTRLEIASDNAISA